MKILILGATGLIGSAVARAACRHGHSVTGLARSNEACDHLQSIGVTPLMGDIRHPSSWGDALLTNDILIQCATTWSDDMGATDHSLTQYIVATTKNRQNPLRVLYTGGCWLYGETGEMVATEMSPRPGFAPFNWMIKSADLFLGVPHLSTAVIHPAMVYDGDMGATARFVKAVAEGGPIEIWGDAKTRWPLIHADDLGNAYTHLAPRHDQTGHFNASTETGLSVGEITNKIAKRAHSSHAPVTIPARTVLKLHGEWAAGPMLDQQMSSFRLRKLGWSPTRMFI